MKVILIDDDHGPMDYFVEAMQMRGIEVEHIDHADTAWEMLEDTKANPPDAFVIDVMMPHGQHLTAEETDEGMKTGFFLIAKCRNRFPETPVVCLTNYNGSEEMRNSLNGVPFVQKFEASPFQFADQIEALLKRN